MIGVISDIHANYAALQAVLDDARQLGCEKFICLGDIAGYHVEINECIDLLRSLNQLILLRGNHDQYLLGNQGCKRSKHVTNTLMYQRQAIRVDNLEWISHGTLSHVIDRTFFYHGGPSDPLEQYIYTVTADLFPSGCECLFVGHSHVQCQLTVENKLFCNPGSVGQPRDGDCRSAYAVLTSQGPELRRVAYDVARTQKVMATAGFPEYSYANLSTGAQIGGRIDSIRLSPVLDV